MIYLVVLMMAGCASSVVSDGTDKNVNNVTKINLCSTVNNEQGQCILLTECKSLYNLIAQPLTNETKNYLRKSHCGFIGKTPKVCCSLTDRIFDVKAPMMPVLSTVEHALKLGIALPDLSVCGLFPEDRIIPGYVVPIGGYPWTVLLEYQKPQGRGFHCGGSLISNRYILTAAHCILDVPADWNLFSVRLGEHDTTKNLDCVEFADIVDCAEPVVDVKIEKKIVHENYIPDDVNKHHDIALLRLTRTILFTDFIKPICLPPRDQYEETKPMNIAGWGAKKQNEAKGLKEISTIHTTNNSVCRSQQLWDDQICFVQNVQYQNVCAMDGGGTLMATNDHFSHMGNYFAMGVLSLVPNDCSALMPLIGIKVTNYLQWILNNMQS